MSPCKCLIALPLPEWCFCQTKVHSYSIFWNWKHKVYRRLGSNYPILRYSFSKDIYLPIIVNRSVIQLYLIWFELILSSPRRRYLFLKIIRFFVNRLQVSTYYTSRTNKSKDINSSYNPVFCFREVSISKERWLQAKQVTDWRISTRSRRLEKAPMELSSRYVFVPNSNWEVF